MELGGVPQKKDELYSIEGVFQAHLRLPPRPVSQNNEKNCFAMKTNGIRWRSSKMDEPSPGFHGFSRSMSKI